MTDPVQVQRVLEALTTRTHELFEQIQSLNSLNQQSSSMGVRKKPLPKLSSNLLPEEVKVGELLTYYHQYYQPRFVPDAEDAIHQTAWLADYMEAFGAENSSSVSILFGDDPEARLLQFAKSRKETPEQNRPLLAMWMNVALGLAASLRVKPKQGRNIQMEPSYSLHLPLNDDELERLAYDPISINSAWHNGCLYYPIETVVVEKDPKSKEGKVERIETVVIRSDRTTQKVLVQDGDSDNPMGSRVIRLTDGTMIDRFPSGNRHGTWEWDSINRYLAGETPPQNPADHLYLMHEHLSSRVWLPHQESYWLLALTALATYVQPVFDAVPLILLMGPAGTGKSELGMAMCEISANAVMIGETSRAGLVRLMDESSGLVVIDDLESVAAKGRGKANFSDMAQMLKVSYKRATATKVLTDTRTMRTRTFNFFGIKLISNTAGVDQILGSRMLKVQTRRMPAGMKPVMAQKTPMASDALRELRNKLHTWAFCYCKEVSSLYNQMYSSKSNREDEIAAPLRVLARMSESPEIEDALEIALGRQAGVETGELNPTSLLERIVRDLGMTGQAMVSTQHLALEMRRRAINENMSWAGEGAWSRPDWIGRRLRELALIDEKAPVVRKRLHGSNLRLVTLNPSIVQRQGRKVIDPLSFCGICSTCDYADVGCELRALRR